MAEIPNINNPDQIRRDAGRTAISMRGMTQILVVIMLWAICYPLITTGISAFPPLHFAALRSVLAGASLLAAVLALKRQLLPDRNTWPVLLLVALTFTTMGFTGMFLAGGRVTPGLATVIANAQPLLAASLGYFLLAERLTATRGVALLAGFIGILVIATPGLLEQAANSTPAGIALVLAGAAGVAIGNVLLKRIANQLDPMAGMAWILLLGAVPLAVAAMIFEQTALIDWSIAAVVNLTVLSVLGTAIAFVLWLDILRREDLNLLNTYTFLTPVFALIIGMSFYNERLSVIEWIGVAIIVIAVLLANRPSVQDLRKSPVKVSANTSGNYD